MKRTNVVNLGRTRDMLAQIDLIRAQILSGDMEGFGFYSLQHGKATLILGGSLREDSEDAIRAILKLSAIQARAEDEPPPLQTKSCKPRPPAAGYFRERTK